MKTRYLSRLIQLCDVVLTLFEGYFSDIEQVFDHSGTHRETWEKNSINSFMVIARKVYKIKGFSKTYPGRSSVKMNLNNKLNIGFLRTFANQMLSGNK